MRNRWVAYAGLSVGLAAGVVLKAMHQRPNFYSAFVYLAQSSANLMILTNLCFLTACTFLIGLQKLLYGPLRPIEIEQLYEKAWFAVTETCLAMTIFRGEMGGWFLVMFFALLASKVWGWIGEGRVEVLEQQPPAHPRLFHTRLAISLSLSMLFNSYMLEYLVKQVLHQARPDMMVMFGFEFAVLTILSTSTMARYAINLVEILIVRQQKERKIEQIKRERREAAQAATAQTTSANVNPVEVGSTADAQSTSVIATPNPVAAQTSAVPEDAPIDESELEVEGWEEKGRMIFYLDLATDFLKLVVYLTFFFILLAFYGLPIHIMRDVFLTCRSFFKRIADFLKYRAATKDMNERYPDATVEEVSREEVCIICREEMRPLQPTNGPNGVPARNPVAERMRPKKLPCGHILHFSCLRSWLERQQICPTCRRPVVPTHRIRLGGANQAAGVNPAGQANPVIPGQRPAGQVDGADGQAPPAQNRLRMVQFGPLRIGFGAGRGDLVQDLAQQIHGGEPRPGPGDGQNRAQQYGIGFSIGRPRPQTPRPAVSGTISEQLLQIEQQLQQEAANLRSVANELNVVRVLEGEIARLRNLRQAPGGPPNGGFMMPPPLPMQIPLGVPPAQGFAQGFVANPQGTVLTSDSQNLPEGLALPAGWTMMPLRRLDGLGRPNIQASFAPNIQAPFRSSAPTNSQAPSTQPSAPPMARPSSQASAGTHGQPAMSTSGPSTPSILTDNLPRPTGPTNNLPNPFSAATRVPSIAHLGRNAGVPPLPRPSGDGLASPSGQPQTNVPASSTPSTTTNNPTQATASNNSQPSLWSYDASGLPRFTPAEQNTNIPTLPRPSGEGLASTFGQPQASMSTPATVTDNPTAETGANYYQSSVSSTAVPSMPWRSGDQGTTVTFGQPWNPDPTRRTSTSTPILAPDPAGAEVSSPQVPTSNGNGAANQLQPRTYEDSWSRARAGLQATLEDSGRTSRQDPDIVPSSGPVLPVPEEGSEPAAAEGYTRRDQNGRVGPTNGNDTGEGVRAATSDDPTKAEVGLSETSTNGAQAGTEQSTTPESGKEKGRSATVEDAPE